MVIAFFLLVFVLYLFNGIIFLDPDFGWHLRMGQLIISSGVPKTDPFSYTMPSFPFIDHEWLTNLLIAKFYHFVDKSGLAFIYSLLALLAVFLATINPLSRKVAKMFNPSRFMYVPFILGTGTLFAFSGVRPQIESWLFFSIFLIIVLNYFIWKRLFWVLPFFVILWSNLHGSFAVSIVTLLLIAFLRSIRQKKVWLDGFLVAFICLLATFINPYGTRLWHEVLQQVTNTSVRWTILEWRPAIFVPNIAMWGLISVSTLLLLRYRRKFRLEELGLNFWFLLQGLASVRHIPLWVMVNLPMFVLSIKFFGQEAARFKYGRSRFARVYRFAIWGSILIFIIQTMLHILSTTIIFSRENFYPKSAILFLKNNPPVGQIFSEYGWGGYLIWKLPEKKVFIDGRMATWKWDADLPGQSNYAMKDYLGILMGEISYQEIFEKYGIDTVLWPLREERYVFGILQNMLEKLLINLGMEIPTLDLLERIKEDGWVVSYQDSTSIIYREGVD